MWLPSCEAATLRRKTKARARQRIGGAAEDGIDADEQAGGDAPGQLFGRGSHAEECEDGKGDAAVEPVVVDGSGSLVGVLAIGLSGCTSDRIDCVCETESGLRDEDSIW